MRLETFPTFTNFNKSAALNLLFLGQSSSLFLSVRENGAPLLCRGHTTQPNVVVKLCVAGKHFPCSCPSACRPAASLSCLSCSALCLCTCSARSTSCAVPIPISHHTPSIHIIASSSHPFASSCLPATPPPLSLCALLLLLCCLLSPCAVVVVSSLLFAVPRAVLAVVDCTVGRSLRLRRCCSRESESERCSGRHEPQQTFLLWAARVRNSTAAPQRPRRATARRQTRWPLCVLRQRKCSANFSHNRSARFPAFVSQTFVVVETPISFLFCLCGSAVFFCLFAVIGVRASSCFLLRLFTWATGT